MARTATTNRNTATKQVENTEQTATTEQVAQEPAVEAKVVYNVKPTELDPNMYVPVRNGFNGKLVYVSRKTGERYVWESFGDVQDMELRELRNAKTSYKAFFTNNWFLIDDPAVIEYLGVERFYEKALSYEEFDALFTLPADEIKERISQLSSGQKSSLAYRARQLIREGGIDSIRVINALENSLNIELIEK